MDCRINLIDRRVEKLIKIPLKSCPDLFLARGGYVHTLKNRIFFAVLILNLWRE